MTEQTRRHYLEQAVARAHWRVVQAAVRREYGPPLRRPVNIEADGVVDAGTRAVEPTVKRGKMGRRKALKKSVCYDTIVLDQKFAGSSREIQDTAATTARVPHSPAPAASPMRGQK